jgi:hypothetical protein
MLLDSILPHLRRPSVIILCTLNQLTPIHALIPLHSLHWQFHFPLRGKNTLSCDPVYIKVPCRTRMYLIGKTNFKDLTSLQCWIEHSNVKIDIKYLPIKHHGGVWKAQTDPGILLLLSPPVDRSTRLTLHWLDAKPDQTTPSAQRCRQRWGQANRQR